VVAIYRIFQFICVSAFVKLGLVSSVPFKSLVGENVSEMSFFVCWVGHKTLTQSVLKFEPQCSSTAGLVSVTAVAWWMARCTSCSIDHSQALVSGRNIHYCIRCSCAYVCVSEWVFEISATETYRHPFNGLFSRTTWVSWHEKGKNHSGF